ncbi:MAG: ATP-binding cassette domain-containing protein [Candidatus Sumerlaeota bacterium]|nr:ATP-binding cassette domain-containing protein [Candidatus Sumerlaeota bacterium]
MNERKQASERVAPVLEVKDLVAEYGETRILEGVSFSVYKGEILVVLGKSGCGKSTLLRNITRLVEPAAGSVKYWGREVTNLEEDELYGILRRIGISFQGGALFNSMPVFDNVALQLRERTNLPEETIKALVMIKLSLVGLADAAYYMPSDLSGGMRKRAGVARALALDPELLFFDEPSAGLDPVTAAGLDHLIIDLRRLLGVTIVAVTHELDSIKTIADRVLMLDNGGMAFLGTLGEALACEKPAVKNFFTRGEFV